MSENSVLHSLNQLDDEERTVLRVLALGNNGTREHLIASSPWGRSKTDAIAKRLVDRGFLIVDEIRNETKGRSRFVYSVAANMGYVAGVELNPSGDRISVSDLNGQIVAQREMAGSIEFSDVVESLDNNLSVMLKEAGIPPEKVGALCIGVHGLANEREGVVQRFLYHDEEVSIRFADYFQEARSWQCYIGRPKHLICLKEHANSYIAGQKTFVNVNIGFGVGLSIFVQGEYYPGFSGYSGEFGHVIVPGREAPCYCGNRGCLRTLASYKGMCNEALSRLDEFQREGVFTPLETELLQDNNYEVGAEHLIEQAAKHEKLSVHLMQDIATHVGETLATVVSVLNPEILIIHSNLIRAGDSFTAPLDAAIRRNALSLSLRDLKIEYLEWPRFAVSEGATVLALQRLLV